MRAPTARVVLLIATLIHPLTLHAQHNSPEVIRAKERALPRGKLPTWETEAERRTQLVRPPRVFRNYDGLLPPPPAPGYRVPAEFEPVSAFIVSQGDWSDLTMMIDMLIKGTQVGGARAIVLTRQEVSSFENTLANRGVDLSRVTVLRPPNGLNARWARDFGPISLYEQNPGGGDGLLAFVDLHYYDGRARDDAVPEYLADSIGLSRYGLEGNDQSPSDEYKLYMEGGNFQTDGHGTCILSNDVPEDNRLNQDANTYDKAERILAEYLGCERVIWLTPVPNTSTSHVDLYTKLLTPTDILVIDMPNQTGNNGRVDAIVDENAQLLEQQGFTVHRVLIPTLGSWWTYKTYTNSVILNHVVLVPTYSSPNYDDDALNLYRNILGDEYVVEGIDSTEIAPMGGSVHCTTMQIASACGDGVLQPALEDCDADEFSGETCETLGHEPGTLACDETCYFDVTSCNGEPIDTDTEEDAGTDTDSDTATDTDSDASVDTDTLGDTDGTIDAGWSEDDAFGSFDSGCGCRIVGLSRQMKLWSLPVSLFL